MFSIRGLRLYFPTLEPRVAQSVSLPICSSQFICTQVRDRLVRQPPPHLVHQLLLCPESFSPGCPPPPLLPDWMNVSSLTPWLSDFHAVRFSVSSGCFLFLNLLSFFWLCRRSKCIYLCLHLGWKRSSISTSVKPNTHIFYFFQNPTSITNIYVS